MFFCLLNNLFLINFCSSLSEYQINDLQSILTLCSINYIQIFISIKITLLDIKSSEFITQIYNYRLLQNFRNHMQKLQQRSNEEQYGQPDQHQTTCYESCLTCCGSCSGSLKIFCPCICCCCGSPLYQLETSKMGILQNFGRFKSVIKPGLHIINPWTEAVIQIDMKTNVLNLQPQTVITKDNVSLRIDTTVYYRTINPYKLIYKLGNNLGEIRNFIAQMSYSAMRTVVGQTTFQDLLEKRKQIADSIQNYVAQSVNTWGLFIENIFIKDLILTEETKKNMQSAAIQKRLSQANIISAKADVESAKMLKQTSQILNSQSAMQIRYLQTLQVIINSNNSKTMFVSLKGKQ